jgi:hypothetical protein
MLIDDLVANGAPGSGSDISCLFPVLRSAQKFILNAEFTAVAEALTSDFTGLVRAFPFCRLPYPVTWIEMIHLDRPGFASAPMQAPKWQVAPQRVGYLLTATRSDLSAWKASLFWSSKHYGCSCPPIAIEFDMTNSFGDSAIPSDEEMEAQTKASLVLENVPRHPGWASADDSVRAAMLHHTNVCWPDYPLPMLDGIRLDLHPKVYSIIEDLARSDWAGEPSFILATIALLNAKNATETEEVDHAEYNRKRARRGRLPLFSHRVVKIARRQHKRTSGHPSAPGDYTAMRGHFVKGHWKHRSSGLYFWRPHARGDFVRGVVHKTYRVVR